MGCAQSSMKVQDSDRNMRQNIKTSDSALEDPLDKHEAGSASTPSSVKPSRGKKSPRSPRKAMEESYKAVAKDYELGETLGRGGFGEVRAATHLGTGETVAIKMISKIKFATREDLKYMHTETNLMARVRGHENVVNLIESRQDKMNYYLIMELCQGGELMNRIIKRTHFSEKVAACYFKQMCLGLKHCHDNQVMHRDLKPENFIFESDRTDAGLKLTDFGLGVYLPSSNHSFSDACGSAYYIAPEMFKGRYTKAADVWSLGVILFLLLSGTVPFGAKADKERDVYQAIQKDTLKLEGSRWKRVSHAARELLAGLLEKEPAKRYTLEQVLQHPWVTGQAADDTPIDRSIVVSMYNFNNKNKFKKQALKLIASTLSASDVQHLRDAFMAMDKSGVGTITFEDLNAALQRLGMSEQFDVKQLMEQLDGDHDGTISYEEFLLATAERQLVHHQRNIWWAFCLYDEDGDGQITADELRKVLKHEKPEMVDAYIKEYDLNGDGKIDYEEFMRMVLPKDLKYRISKYS